MLRHAHSYIKGGELPFAASAKSKGQREESGRSGHQPVFSVVQTPRMAARSPLYQISVTWRMAAITREPETLILPKIELIGYILWASELDTDIQSTIPAV
jgi:hypothetical protein